MKETQATLAVVNQMQADGIIGKYAIGGAVGAAFYIEATSTSDIDIFIPFESSPDTSFVSLSPIFNYLIQRGCKPEGAHIVIGAWPVQFLPADDALYKEALQHAVETEIGGVKTSVMTAEHLMAIALKTGRGKDLIRIEQFVQLDIYDQHTLNEILTRHNLVEKWRRFYDKYIEGGK